MDTITFVHLSLHWANSHPSHNHQECPGSPSILDVNQTHHFGGVALRSLSLPVLLVGLTTFGTAAHGWAALTQGSQGEEVTELQSQLQKLGYLPTPPTGYFGTLTEEAVVDFQEKHQLQPDGIVGGATQSAILQGMHRQAPQPFILGYGDRNPRVLELQQRLRDLGFYHGPVEGAFGSQTKTAVLQFQQSRGLKVDGLVGTETQSSLNQPSPNPSPGKTATQPASPPIQFKPGTLRLGDRHPSVEMLQNRLQSLGFLTGTVTGIYNTETRLAVEKFQSNHQLKPDGIVGKITWAALGISTPINLSPQPNSHSSTPSPSLQKTTNPSPTPDEPSHSQPRSLSKGDQGRDVLQLQQTLQSLGYFNDQLSGSFNDSTHTAVIRFQQNRKITADGVVGQLTRQALEVASTPSVQGGTPTPASTPGGSQPQIKAPSPSPVPSEPPSPTLETSSPSPSPSPYRLTVKEMQQLLKKQGFYAGEVDGELNDLTRAAIIAAQDYFKIDESTIWSGQIPNSNSTQS